MNSPISSKRVFNSSSREIGNGTEYAAKVEVLREDGTKSLADVLARRTDTDQWTSVQATFVIQRFAAQQDSPPSGTDVFTGIMDTEKGEVEGDYRWQTSQATYISSKGIYRLPPVRAKFPVASRERELSVEEMMEEVVTFWDRM